MTVTSALSGLGPISVTVTAIECGSSSRTPSSVASRISSAIITSVGSSVVTSAGYSDGPAGNCAISRSTSRSTWSPILADTGMMSAKSPSRLAASSCSAIRLGGVRSVLVTMAIFGARTWASWAAM